MNTIEMNFIQNLKDIEELRCSLTNQLIKLSEAFYILPFKYLLNFINTRIYFKNIIIL